MRRSSGILMPMTSLPSPYGIGTMGKSAYQFVDFLKEAGQSWWQILPLGPTSYGDSPYQSFSSFAGNPYLIDLEMLVQEGLLTTEEIEACDWGTDPERVDYGKVFENRFSLLRLAYTRGASALAEEIGNFRRANCRWVETYALFMSLKGKYGNAAWTEWPDEDLRLHRRDAVVRSAAERKDEVSFYVFVQYLFFKQWNALRDYAHANGVEFIGDIPIYVALDSADVWSEPEFFLLDEQNVPTEVAGVPPDAFTADGQLWGNPLYNWEKMQADGYGWWLRRIDGARALYDVIRIDHFRGLESFWAVPYGEATARNGYWVKGPGVRFVSIIKNWFPDIRIIAEDLGYVTPEVRALLDASGFPGMKILEFAFGMNHDYMYLPHNCERNSVTYLGTHDNDTLSGWLQVTQKKEKAYAEAYIPITDNEGWTWGMIRCGMATCSDLFILQMQDLLELGPEARMNTPGKPDGNWQWRMLSDALNPALAKKLRGYTERYFRVQKKKAEPAEDIPEGKAPEKETQQEKTTKS